MKTYFFTIVSFIADEELGGHDGMKQYVVSKEFKKLNIGLALDEGLASPTEVMPVYYGERNVFWVRFHCTGKFLSKNLKDKHPIFIRLFDKRIYCLLNKYVIKR